MAPARATERPSKASSTVAKVLRPGLMHNTMQSISSCCVFHWTRSRYLFSVVTAESCHFLSITSNAEGGRTSGLRIGNAASRSQTNALNDTRNPFATSSKQAHRPNRGGLAAPRHTSAPVNASATKCLLAPMVKRRTQQAERAVERSDQAGKQGNNYARGKERQKKLASFSMRSMPVSGTTSTRAWSNARSTAELMLVFFAAGCILG